MLYDYLYTKHKIPVKCHESFIEEDLFLYYNVKIPQTIHKQKNHCIREVVYRLMKQLFLVM